MGEHLDAVLFDLDGTLVDTAPDLGGALNRVLAARGHRPLPAATIRPHVSRGARGLVELGYQHYDLGSDRDAVRAELLAEYEDQICVGSVLFPSMSEVLTTLEARGTCWGIVTNKPTYLTEPLLALLGLAARAACVVCGDTAAHPKPHPAPLRHAAGLIDRPAGRCLYVGDDRRDVEAARAAAMPVIVAGYGYLGPGAAPETWNADGIVDHPKAILDWIADR